MTKFVGKGKRKNGNKEEHEKNLLIFVEGRRVHLKALKEERKNIN